MSSSSDLREKIKQKRRALRESLAKDRDGTDTQALVAMEMEMSKEKVWSPGEELTTAEEDQVESLKKSLRDQRQRRKKKLLRDVPPEDTVVELVGAGPGAEPRDVRQAVASPEPMASTSGMGRSSRELPPLPVSPLGSSQSQVSMRQRMQEKLQAARSRSLQQDSALESVSRLHALRDRDTLTRFDRELEGRPGSGLHDDGLPSAARVRFQEAAFRVRQKTEKDTGLPTAEEAYNFFTFNFDPEPQEEPAKGRRTRRVKDQDGEGEEAEGEEEGEEEGEMAGEQEEGEETDDRADSTPLGGEGEEELLLLDTRTQQDFLQVKGAEYQSYTSRMQREQEMLFTPSLQPAPVCSKVGENMQPRYLEEEGLYVGVRPEVSRANQNILENRILRQEAGKECLEPEVDPAIQTIYRKAVKSKYASRYLPGVGVPEGDYQLDIDVSGLIFTHHALFSREHVLAARLAQLYDQYLSRQNKNLTGLLTDKLDGLRNAVNRMIELHSGQGLTPVTQQRIFEYKQEIRSTRRLRDAEQEKDRVLLKSVLKVWREMKALREFQRFTNTPYKLLMRREEVQREQDERRYEEEIRMEVAELQEEVQEEYERQLSEYRRQQEEWRSWRRRWKARKKKKERKREEAEEGEEEEEEAEEEELGAEPQKPALPERQDPEALEQQVREKASRIRRRPGEAVLQPELSASSSTTPNQLCPRGELARREDVGRRSLFARVLYNDKEVSRTDSRALSQDFRVHFGQIFNLRIVNWPESIRIQVFEVTGVSQSLLAEVFVPLPEASVLTGSAPTEELEFSSNQRCQCSHEGVGSGVAFSFEADGSNSLTLLTSGKLACCVSWAAGEDHAPRAPPVSQPSAGLHSALKQVDAIACIGASGLNDMKKLGKWAAESRLDPNDPSNAALMQLLTVRGREVSYKVFQVRGREVSDKVFQDYEKRQRDGEIVDTKDHLDAHRAMVAKYLQKVRESVINRFIISKHHFLLSDLVQEEEVPSIGVLGLNLFKLAEPKRPLKPQRKERKKVTAQNLTDGDIRVLVNIIRAYDIPIRKPHTSKAAVASRSARSFTEPFAAGQPSQSAPQGSDWPLMQVSVQPFVEVTFQRSVRRTTAADGPNPCWNEELDLPFSAPNGDYSTSSLQSMRDEVFINIFDQVVYDVVEVSDG
ncbi:hypothetical protein GJAV_G00086040 [Gymnothorax javanicus]|nr:hypothetical protein GJAV_G00086040 [Gymnothorax javanicus]